MHICLMYQKDFLKGTIKTMLLCLLDEQGEMYGYEITQTVKSRTSEEINLTEGALYPALHKMEATLLVVSTAKKIEGRTRKYYQLTPLGKKEAQKAKEGWSAFSSLMGHIINPMSHA
jgi:PadR family transcriptional regulator PadR